MQKITLIITVTALSLGACITISKQEPARAAAPIFVTSTLLPTKSSLPLATRSPVTSATEQGSSQSALSGTAPANCREGAVLLEDVTIPDNASLPRGSSFTKTWRFKNTSNCPWSGYTIAFLAGDRLGAPDSSPVPQTAPDTNVDISVDLQAPGLDGAYTGYFVLHNAAGEIVPIGIESSFWVKIIIGNVSPSPAAPPSAVIIGSTPLYTPGGPLSCDYFLSASYHAELAGLINSARTEAGLPALALNTQLAAAAQDHSIDMACFGLLSHSGSDGSSIYERITASGYSPSYYAEVIYASGYPQTAFDWWMNDQVHRDVILSPNAAEMGVGYAYNSGSFYKGYYTVDFGSR